MNEAMNPTETKAMTRPTTEQVPIKPLHFATTRGVAYRLLPVQMPRLPSATPSDWLAFQGKHVAGSEMSVPTQNKVQAYMMQHRTEALTDGKSFFTLAGGLLATCFPAAIQ